MNDGPKDLALFHSALKGLIIPPHSEEGELWILSGLMNGGSEYVDDVITKIEECHFYERNNKIVFNAIVKLHESSSPINPVTVGQKLKDLFQLEEIGGVYGVHKIASSAPTTAHAEYWIDILEDKKMARAALELISLAERQLVAAENVKDFISELETKVLALRKFEDGGNVLSSTCDSAIAKNDNFLKGIKTIGIQTGIKPIDSTIGGLCPSNLIYLCARPGKGKTALLEQIFNNIIEQDRAMLIFQRDMPVEMMIERMACRNASLSYFVYRMGNCSREDNLRVKHELEKLKRHQNKLIVRTPFRLTAQDLLSIVRRDKNKYGIEAVFLDHIQNIDIPEKDFREGLTRASSTIRRSAQDSKIPHVIIAQLNREAQEGRPKASHVKEFDAAYADCDAMIMLWSETSQADLSPGELLPVKFLFSKNRYGPETEEEMLFDGSILKFKNKKL